MLDEYCRRYNVGWIIAWSPAVLQRLRAWPGVESEIAVHDDVAGASSCLKHPGPGYITRGHAHVITMDSRHIVLADVIPEDGEVILNLHYLSRAPGAPEPGAGGTRAVRPRPDRLHPAEDWPAGAAIDADVGTIQITV